jgi:hypothetical protein
MRPYCDQDRLEALVEKIIQVVDPVVQAQLNPKIQDVRHFSLDDLRRQTIFWYPQPEHTTGYRHSFQHGHRKTSFYQVSGCGKPAGAGSNDGYTLVWVFHLHWLQGLARF